MHIYCNTPFQSGEEMLKVATLVSLRDDMKPCHIIQTLIDKGSPLLWGHQHRTNPNALQAHDFFLVGLKIIFM